MITLRKSARIVLLTGLLAAPGLALAEGAPPAAHPGTPKAGESAKAADKKPEAKAHKKAAKVGEKDKGAEHSQH